MLDRQLLATFAVALGSLLLAACSKPDAPQEPGDNSQAAGTNPLTGAPQDWPEFLQWAAGELTKIPKPVPLPDQRPAPAPKWPVLRLDEQLGRATIRCEWQPSADPGQPLASVGPINSDHPGANVRVQAKPDVLEPGLLVTISGFTVQRERVGSISIELRQPVGRHFELRWSRAGRIRVPLPDNQRFWTLNIATDGLAEWTGPLNAIRLQTDGIGDQPVEIRSIRFLSPADSFPQPVGVRRVTLARETRNALYVHCPGEVRFAAVALPLRAHMQVGLGGIAAAGGESAGPFADVALEIIADHQGRQTTVWSGPLPPRSAWSDVSISLEPWAGQTVSLILRATGQANRVVACWANPVVYQPVDDPPCVIIYLIDALAAGHVDLYGYQRPTMPRLSALARSGVWFANAFANSPRTVESVPDLMLSLPTESHGVYHPSAATPGELVTLPESLRAAGFATASFSTNVNAGPRQNIDQGFDHFFDRIAYWWTGQADRTVPIDDVIAWLDVHRDRPAFIYIHTAEPHAPYTPPQGFAGRFDPDYQGNIDGTYDRQHGFAKPANRRDLAQVVALYDEEIAYADQRLGQFLDALATAGLADRTSVFVTADHGEEFQQHGSWEHGKNLHNELMRIPLVAAGPRFASRGRDTTPVQLYDLMPTILDMFDLPAPYPLAGASLLPRLKGAASSGPTGVLSDRTIIASNHAYRGRGFIQYAVIEGGRWKLMYQLPARSKESGRRFEPFGLFDIEADPAERHNVIQTHQDVARRLIARLLEWHRHHAPYEARQPRDRLMFDADQLRELRSLGYIE